MDIAHDGFENQLLHKWTVAHFIEFFFYCELENSSNSTNEMKKIVILKKTSVEFELLNTDQ